MDLITDPNLVSKRVCLCDISRYIHIDWIFFLTIRSSLPDTTFLIGLRSSVTNRILGTKINGLRPRGGDRYYTWTDTRLRESANNCTYNRSGREELISIKPTRRRAMLNVTHLYFVISRDKICNFFLFFRQYTRIIQAESAAEFA